MPLDIRPDHLKIVEEILEKHLPDREVWAFGSRVNGTAKETSDLDLVVIGENSLDFQTLGALRDDFSESNLPYKVDLVDWAKIGETFREIIRKDKIRINNRNLTNTHGGRGHNGGAWNKGAAGGWVTRSLGELIEIKHGFAFKGEYFRNDPPGDILLTPGNFAIGGGFKTDKFKYYKGPVPEDFILQSNDMVVTMTDLSKEADTLGYPAIVPLNNKSNHYLHNQRLGKIIVRDRESIDSGFLYYVMCSKKYRHEIIASATGTTVKHTSPERIKLFRFSLPPLPEQRAIAHILGTLDDKIDLNRRMNETLEAMAQALFKSWFVDFNPVRAKMEGRPTGLPKEIEDLFPDSFEDSELGEIPKGWKVSTIGECFRLTMGQSPPGETYNDNEEGLPFFQGSTDFDFRYPVNRKFCSAPTRVAISEDTLVSVRAPVGDINMAWEKCCIGRGVASIRHKSGKTSYTYYVAWNLQAKLQEYEHTGTVFGAINKKQLEIMKIIEPSEILIGRFESIVRPLDCRIRFNTYEIRTLAALRDTLLPNLLSGDIRVKEVERFLKREL